MHQTLWRDKGSSTVLYGEKLCRNHHEPMEIYLHLKYDTLKIP